MEKITQEMKYRESIVKYAKAKGVSKAARKYNRARSYIYYWRKRYDGTIESLRGYSKKPKSHPKQHREEEIRLIQNMRQRNKGIGLMEFWFKLRNKGYERHYVSLYRMMKKLSILPDKKKKPKKYIAKPYEAMKYPGERIQVDVKVVPKKCIVNGVNEKYYQYTAIDEYSRLRYLEAFREANTYSSAVFIRNAITWFKRRNIQIECVQTDNGMEFTKRLLRTREEENLTLFELILKQSGIKHKYIRPYTPRHNGKVERSHREDQKRFYNDGRFHNFEDFRTLLRKHNQSSNNIPMKPLGFLSPNQFLKLNVQYV